MAYVFISHAIQADGEFAGRLARDLRERGVRVWIAPDSIPGGENWGKYINEALETCDTMIVVQTPDAFASRWVETETFAAIDRYHEGRMKIIPIDVEECAPPVLLRAHQDVSFRRKGYEAALAELSDRLGASTEPNSSQPELGWRELAAYALKGEETTLAPPPVGSLLLPDWLSLRAPVHITKPLLDPVWPVQEQPDDENPFAMPAISLYGLEGLSRRALRDAASAGDEAKEKRDFASAIQHYTKGIDSVKTEPTADSGRSLLGSLYYRRGQCYERMDFIDSITAFDKAGTATWRMAPTLAALQLKGFTQESNKDRAEADYEKARSLGYWFDPAT